MSYDITEQGSRIIRRISGQQDRDPCLENHIWNVPADPGEPVTCIVCGAEFQMAKRERGNLRYNLENLRGNSDG